MLNERIQKVVEFHKKLIELKKFKYETENASGYFGFLFKNIITYSSIFGGFLFFFDDMSRSLKALIATGITLHTIVLFTIIMYGLSSSSNYALITGRKVDKKLKAAGYKKYYNFKCHLENVKKDFETCLDDLTNEDLAEFLALLKEGEYKDLTDDVFDEIDKRNRNIDNQIKREKQINEHFDNLKQINQAQEELNQKEKSKKIALNTQIDSFKRKTFIKEDLRIKTE